MNGHETFAEELTRYLLGELPADERSSLERHLGGCGECRNELERLRAAEALLTLTSPETVPPPRARARLLAAISREPRLAVVHEGPRARPWWIWIPSTTALALAIVVGLLWHENSDLRDKADTLAALETQQEVNAQNAKEVLADLTAKGAIHVNLSESGADPQPHAKATYNPKDGGIVFVASNLTPLPEGQAYQLWIVPMNDGKPIRAASFRPTMRGTAMVMKHDKLRATPKMFAVTIEPEHGTGEPTYPALLSSPIGE